MSEDDFEVGDLVRLKSGGPLMTYAGKRHMTGEAICKWQEGNKTFEETFNHKTIEKSESLSPAHLGT